MKKLAASGYSTLACVAVALFVINLTNESSADDWLQWRGPNRADRSAEKDLLQEWPADGPKKKWQFDKAGLGYAGFSIKGDNLYTMGLEVGESFALCLNAETGNKIWRQKIGGEYNNGWGDGPRSTPTIDDDHVYFLNSKGDLNCLTTKDGKIVWAKQLIKMGGKVPKWGYAESPLVDEKHVYCTPGGKDGAVVALDKKSGELVWQSENVTDGAHYSSIISAKINGEQQLIQLFPKRLVGLSAKTGKLLWESEWYGRVAVIPTPIYKDGIVYITSGYGTGSGAYKIGPDNKVEEVFYNKVVKNHHGGTILVDGNIYGHSDKVGFVCQEFKTGEKVWATKKITKGCVAYADGRFYYVQEKDGTVMLLETSKEGVEVKGKFVMEPQTERRKSKGRIWVHPVISDGKMYLRDQEYIFCYDIKK